MVEAAGPCRCEEDLLGVVERRCCTMEVEIKKKKELLEALALMAANNGSVGFGFHCVRGVVASIENKGFDYMGGGS
jgi:hypothetical protein